MIFTADDAKMYEAVTVCHIRGKPFDQNDENKSKVRDQCHLSGLYRGGVHEDCDFNYKIPKFCRIIFHNLSNYNSHHFIKKLKSADSTNDKICAIACNEERCISFSKEFVVDSFINKEGKNVLVKREL